MAIRGVGIGSLQAQVLAGVGESLVSAAALFGYGSARAKLGGVALSCSISEQHQYQAEVTEFPVDGGAGVPEISDHRRIKPFTITIHGAITDTTLSLFDTVRSLPSPNGGGVQSSDNTSLGDRISGFFGPNVAVQSAYEALRAIFDAQDLFEVVTSLSRYKNMVFTDLTINRDKDTGNYLNFTATLQQLQIANALNIAVAAAPKAAPKKDLGKKPSSEAPKAVEDGSEDSVLYKVLNHFGAFDALHR